MKGLGKKYDEVWFKQRAFGSIFMIDHNSWDYSDSLLLYSPQGQYAYESAQGEDSSYFEYVTKQEHEHLKSVVKEVSDILPSKFEFINLGPGTENKESYFFEEFKKRGKSHVYIPVDFSEYFLDMSKSYAETLSITVNPIQSSFEELSEVIGKPVASRFVCMLGLTFSNYLPQQALKLLRRITGKSGYIMFDIQLSERVNLTELQVIYQKYVAPACDQKIKLLDLDPSIDVSERVTDQQIGISCILNKITPVLQKKGLKVGDRLKLFQSLRPTKEELLIQLKGLDYVILDKGHSFISVIVST